MILWILKRQIQTRMLPVDCLFLVLMKLPALYIVHSRLINKEWKEVVDRITMNEWRALYIQRIYKIDGVSSDFNWMHALVNVEKECVEVEALCTWNQKKVRLVAPWLKVDNILQLDDTFIINSNLREGVARDMRTAVASQGTCITFIYKDSFTLRAVRHTCLRRGDSPCQKCEQRKCCEKQKYVYFVRKLNDNANDCLCMHVKGEVF